MARTAIYNVVLALACFMTDLQEQIMLQEWGLHIVRIAVIYIHRLKINLHTCRP